MAPQAQVDPPLADWLARSALGDRDAFARPMADQALGDVPALAVSLEPPGGSPSGQPTGPVLYSGPCVKYW